MKLLIKLSIIVLLLFAVNCTPIPQKFATISIKGSDTMLKLVEMLAEEYMKANQGVSIYVYGGGSASGIRALSREECNIAMASRKLSAEEVKKIADKFYSIAVSYLIAKDALSVYVHSDNPIQNLNILQLAEIFSGKNKNWKEYMGPDQEIFPIIRTPMSGTHIYFKEHILNGSDFADDAISKSTFEEVLKVLRANKSAIGFGGIGNFQGVKHLNIENIEPTEENVINDKYPLNRYLYFYTVRSANGEVKAFINWVLSSEGQRIIKKSGYIPIWTVKF